MVYALRDVFGCEKKGQLITEFVGLLTKEGWMPIGFLSCRWLFLSMVDWWGTVEGLCISWVTIRRINETCFSRFETGLNVETFYSRGIIIM